MQRDRSRPAAPAARLRTLGRQREGLLPLQPPRRDGLWELSDTAGLFDAGGNIREGVARQRDAPAGFAPDVLATLDREPELVDVAALYLLERHFAPGLHEEILEAVGLEFGVKGSATGAAGGLRASLTAGESDANPRQRSAAEGGGW